MESTQLLLFGSGVLAGLLVNLNGVPLAALGLGTALALVALKLTGLVP